MATRLLLCLLCAALLTGCEARSSTSADPEVIAGPGDPPLLLRAGALRFAIIGDSGRWSAEQRETAAQLAAQRERFPFEFVLMLGDNNYGDGSPESYLRRFEEPFKPLLDAGVKFYAAIGNHDAGPQWNYPLFNMNGDRYYTFERRTGVMPTVAGQHVQFFALDTVNLDDDQLVWIDQQLSRSRADWKIVFQHHPLYTSGRYRMSSGYHRRTLEQTFIEHEVDVVFAGHEHVYERITPQSGVMYFVCGAAGSVRVGDLQRGPQHATGFDTDLSFMLAEIVGDTMYFQAVTRAGETVDRGRIRQRRASSQPDMPGDRQSDGRGL